MKKFQRSEDAAFLENPQKHYEDLQDEYRLLNAKYFMKIEQFDKETTLVSFTHSLI